MDGAFFGDADLPRLIAGAGLIMMAYWILETRMASRFVRWLFGR